MKICWKHVQLIDKPSKLIAIIIDWKAVEELKSSKSSKDGEYCVTSFELTDFDDFVISVFGYRDIFNDVKQFVFHDLFESITTQLVVFIFGEMFALSVFPEACKQEAAFYFSMPLEIVFEAAYLEYLLKKGVGIVEDLSKFVWRDVDIDGGVKLVFRLGLRFRHD